MTAKGLESITCCVPISVGKTVVSHVAEKSELREGGIVFQMMLEVKAEG